MKQVQEKRISHRAFTLSKMVALLAVVFLLTSTLDRVPDCPELLNSSRGQAVSLQLGHGADFAATPSIPYVFHFSVSPTVTLMREFSKVRAAPPLAYVSWSGYQFSDTSPPSL
jgi:hypothetical protein